MKKKKKTINKIDKKKECTEGPQILQQVPNKKITEIITEIYFLLNGLFFLDNNAINCPSSYFPNDP